MTTHSPIQVAQQLAQAFAARADEADKRGELPAADMQALKETGYLSLSVPAEYGGMGCSLQDCVAAHIELSKGSAATGMVAGMTMHLFGHAREQRFWDEATFAQFCRLIIEDGAVFNSVASEPALGSPSRGGLFHSHALLAEDDDHWVINGHKTWVTGGRHLTHMLVGLRVDDENRQIVVPQGLPGIEWQETWRNALSLRASDSHDVLFHEVIVPKENLIKRQRPNKGTNIWFPMVMSAVYLGAALAARDAVIQFALERIPTALGKAIATLPKIQRQIGEIDLLLQATQAYFLQVAGKWQGKREEQQLFLPQVAAAKTMVNQTANKVTDMALQIAGGQSITKELPLERFFRDVRAGSMQPPSGDTALEMIGKAAIEERRMEIGD